MAAGTATEQLSRIDDSLATLVAQGEYMRLFLEFAYTQNEEKISFLMNELQFQTRDENSFPGQIYRLLETLNNNTALNAQNAQTLQLASFNACCDDPFLPIGVPPDLCQRAQAVFDIVAAFAQDLCELQATAFVPDAAFVRELMLHPEINARNPYLITPSEANAIVAYIAQRGNSGLAALCDLATRTDLLSSYLLIFADSQSAAVVNGRIQGNAINTGEIDLGMAGIIKLLFSTSIVGLIYDSEIDVQADSYDAGACGDVPPPEEWTYENHFNRLVTDSVAQYSNGTFCFGVGETECADNGWEFEFEIDTACATFAGAEVQSKPENDTQAVLDAVGSKGGWTISLPAEEGWRIQWYPMPEGETCYVEYTVRARPA